MMRAKSSLIPATTIAFAALLHIVINIDNSAGFRHGQTNNNFQKNFKNYSPSYREEGNLHHFDDCKKYLCQPRLDRSSSSLFLQKYHHQERNRRQQQQRRRRYPMITDAPHQQQAVCDESNEITATTDIRTTTPLTSKTSLSTMTKRRKTKFNQQLGEYKSLTTEKNSSIHQTSRRVQFYNMLSSSSMLSSKRNAMIPSFQKVWDFQKHLLQLQVDRLELCKQNYDNLSLEEASALFPQFLPYTSATSITGSDNDSMKLFQSNLGSFPTRIGGGVDSIIFVEHLPVYTLGTGSDTKFILDSHSNGDKSDNENVEIVRIERGGEVTYHGPGQLVCYPILDMRGYKQDLHWYIRALEESVILALKAVGIPNATREDGITGVWINNCKVAAVGVKVKKWITMHGVAINITHESLEHFNGIVPCGLVGRKVACINNFLEKNGETLITVEEFASAMKDALEHVFRVELVDCAK